MTKNTQIQSGAARLVATLVVLVGIASGANAALLSVDFQHTTTLAPGVTQAGFLAFANDGSASGSETRTFGNIDVTISGHAFGILEGFFNRGNVSNGGSFTFADLYNDFVFNNNGDGSTLTLALSGTGIAADTPYDLTFYSYDAGDGTGPSGAGSNHSVVIAGTAGTVGSASNIVYTVGTNPTVNDQLASTGVFTSDGSGVLTIQLTDTIVGGGPSGIRLNAFELDLAAFDPGSLIAVSSYVYDGLGGETAGAQPSTFLANFADTGTTELTDGVIVNAGGFDQPGYVGFMDDDADDGTSHPQVTFDLGGVFDVSLIDVFYRDVEATIQEPDSVLISVSTDGVNFTTPVSFGPFDDEGIAGASSLIDVTALPDAQFVRMDFRQSAPWVLLSEVQFRGFAASTAIPVPAAMPAGVLLLGLMSTRRRRTT